MSFESECTHVLLGTSVATAMASNKLRWPLVESCCVHHHTYGQMVSWAYCRRYKFAAGGSLNFGRSAIWSSGVLPFGRAFPAPVETFLGRAFPLSVEPSCSRHHVAFCSVGPGQLPLTKIICSSGLACFTRPQMCVVSGIVKPARLDGMPRLPL